MSYDNNGDIGNDGDSSGDGDGIDGDNDATDVKGNQVIVGCVRTMSNMICIVH